MANKKAARKSPAKKRAVKLKKSSQDLIDAFARTLERLPENAIEQKKMFGYPAAFVNGNLFCGLHEETCFVRLDEEQREAGLAKHGAGYFAPMGRRVREYITLPSEITGDQKKFDRWIGKGFEFTASLPVKVKKPKKKN